VVSDDMVEFLMRLCMGAVGASWRQSTRLEGFPSAYLGSVRFILVPPSKGFGA